MNHRGLASRCAALLFVLGFPAVVFAQDVAVLGAPSTASWNSDVQAKIQGTGLFSTVDAYMVDSSTPSLGTLQGYDAVLVYSDMSFADFTAIGDVLADYMDWGGGVVLCTFAFYTPGGLGIGGRVVTDGYLPFTTAGQSQSTQMQLVADLPGHELLFGVTSFDGGSSSYHNSSISTVIGATQVAHWTNNQPLVATWAPTAGTIVGLNFYPPSSTARSDFWSAATDGDLLMANALLYAANAANPDADGDGWTVAQGDCDDGNPTVYPGATEVCDGIDQDCDTVIDEGTSCYDDDGDGYTEDGGDCDDSSPAIYPGAVEICNGLDDDCDGTVDEGTDCYDDDGDGYTEDDGDCDDTSPAIHPGAPELCNGLDDNCNGLVDEDSDGDGYGACVDCDDGDAAVFPGALEDCADAIDNDCDGFIDMADPDCVVGDDDTGDDDTAGDDDTGDDDVGDDDVGDDDVGDDDVGDDDGGDDDGGDDDGGDDDTGGDDDDDDDASPSPTFGNEACQCRVAATPAGLGGGLALMLGLGTALGWKRRGAA